MPEILDPAVKAAYDDHPEPLRSMLLELRRLVLEVAADDPRVGMLDERLSWGQPSYVPRPAAGTGVRLAAHGSEHGALLVHCGTPLVARWRERLSRLTFEGTRAIVLDPREPLLTAQLGDCIHEALTYRLAG